jgi:hypothetical protein
MPRQLQLGLGSNWEFLYQIHLYSTFVPSSSSGFVRGRESRIPIPEAPIPILPDSHILAARGDSDSAKSFWKTAGYLKQTYPVGGGSVLPSVQNSSRKVLLGRAKLIEFPQNSPGYQLSFQVPWYMEDCRIRIWQYVGPQTDTTDEALTAIQGQLNDILQRLDG